MSVCELNVCANAVMHARMCLFQVCLEAIEHACQTLEVDDIRGAKLVARNKSYGGDNRGYVDTL
jgi:hypothetical protein